MDTNRDTSHPNLSPQLKHTFRLWNPLDYLRLLYWVLFFPQALRWYVEAFTDPRHREATGGRRLSALRRDPVQRNLILQAVPVAVLTPLALFAILQWPGVPVDRFGVTIGVVFGIIYGVMRGLEFGAVVGVARAVAAGVARGVTLSIVFGVTSSVAFGVVDVTSSDALGSVVGGAAGGVSLGVTLGVLIGVVNGEAGGVTFGIVHNVTRYVAYSLLGSVGLGLMFGAPLGASFGVGFNLALVVTFLRPVEYLLLALANARFRRVWHASHVVFLPLPGVQGWLETRLLGDWSAGLRDASALLAYTLQFVPVVRAVNGSLASLPQERLLPAVAELIHEPFDWDLVRFCSASLRSAMWYQAIEGLFVIPRPIRRRWQARFPVEPRSDTPARAACAGFWHLHQKEPAKAAAAFAAVRPHPGGEELVLIATALAAAMEAADVVAVGRWHDASPGLDMLPETHLRPTVLHTLQRLRKVVAEAHLAAHSDSLRVRAVAGLVQLLADLEDACAQPEAAIVRAIAEQWRDVLASAGGRRGASVA